MLNETQTPEVQDVPFEVPEATAIEEYEAWEVENFVDDAEAMGIINAFVYSQGILENKVVPTEDGKAYYYMCRKPQRNFEQ